MFQGAADQLPPDFPFVVVDWSSTQLRVECWILSLISPNDTTDENFVSSSMNPPETALSVPIISFKTEIIVLPVVTLLISAILRPPIRVAAGVLHAQTSPGLTM